MSPTSVDNWRYYTITYNGTRDSIFYQGAYVTGGAYTVGTTAADEFQIGRWQYGPGYADVAIDEVRIESTLRDRNWIKLCCPRRAAKAH